MNKKIKLKENLSSEVAEWTPRAVGYKLKIAIVSDAIYPYNKGGKEKRIYELSTRLAKAGHDVHIYCMKWWKGKKNTRNENGVTLHAISPLYPLYSGERRSIKQAVLFALSCFKLLKEDFDILEVDHMPHLVLFSTKVVSLLKGKKLYATWNEVWGRKYWREYLSDNSNSSFLRKQESRLLGELAYLVEWLSARLPDEINSISEHTTKKLKTELKIKQNINTIPMGIDLSVIQKVKASSQTSDVLFAGRLIQHKNVDFLIKSIAILRKKYPNVKCVIVGKGPEELKLKKMVQDMQLQDNVIFYDFLEKHQDLYALMKASKVFAFPSTREGFGIAALEANASGLPVITTNHQDNATKDLIQNGQNGQTIKLDEKQIAKKVLNYLSVDTPTTTYKSAAKKYDWNNIAKRVEEVYLG